MAEHERPSRFPPQSSPAEPPAAAAETEHEYTAPVGGVVEGNAYLIDGSLVVASGAAGAGAKFHGKAGVIEYAKVHEQAWKAGDDVYWDAAGGCFSNSATKVDGSGGANVKVGKADKDAPRPSVTGFVQLERAPAR